MFHKLLIPRIPCSSPLYRSSIIRTMATVRSSLSHEERTAQEPREARLEPVTVSRIDAVNDTIRLIRLSAMNPNHALKVHILPLPLSDNFVTQTHQRSNWHHQSKVPPRPMARRLHPLLVKGRRLHHNLHALTPRPSHSSPSSLLRTRHSEVNQSTCSMALET